MTSPSSVISPPTQHAETRSQQLSGQSNSNNRTSELSPIDEIASFNPTEKRSNPGRDESSTATDFADGNKDKVAFEVTRPPATVVSSSANCQTQNRFDSQHLSNGSLVVDNLPSPVGTPRNLSPASHLKSQLEDLRQIQPKVSLRSEDAPRLPTRDDFLLSISVDIIAGDIDEPVKHIIILLHDYSGTETSLQSLARRLSTRQPNCAYVLLRATEPVSPGNSGYHWADSQNNHDEGFCRCSRRILMDVVQDCLISKCNFNPRNIILLGHCQGGMAALATVASWDQVEFGGVISIGGPMPAYTHLPSDVKARTPALIIRAELGDVTPSAMQCIKENFMCVDSELRNGAHDTIPETPDELRPLLSFFAHRLEREEWEKQAILSLDGGGIRGLGSLLILKALMEKIGDEERRSDREDGCAESSFSPCEYRPIEAPRPSTRASFDSSGSSKTTNIVASAVDGLAYSSLYLPCHYFTYAAGTSTGGLISIMLSRLRMTVDECITEYKGLADKIFGHPRPLATRMAILWHKLSAKSFENVVRDVTARHSDGQRERDSFTVEYPSDEDFCRTLVLAYADNVTSEAPFFFRTYWMPSISRTESMRHGEIVRNQGPAPKLPIWQVARATAAAPGYFPEIKIQTETGAGSQTRRFKDGGFGTNNPSREAYHDIVTKHGGHSKSVGLFVSIGTGQTPFDMFDRRDGFWKMPGFWRRPYANLKAAIRLPSRTLGAHEDVMYYSHHDDKDFFPYYRFDGGKKLGELTMDDWKSYRAPHLRGKNKVSGCITIEKIESAVATYLVRRDIQKALEACAKLLVRRRRLRTRDESAWDRYASASYYECKYKGCERSRINTAQDYKEHVRTRHQFLGVDQAVTNTMRDSRHCWIYRGQSTSTPVVAPSQSTVDLRTTESTRLPAAITVAGALQNSEETQ